MTIPKKLGHHLLVWFSTVEMIKPIIYIFFLACKCGIEATRRIVGGTEVNPVRSQTPSLMNQSISLIFLLFRGTNIPGWWLFLKPMEIVGTVGGPWWPQSTSSLLPTASRVSVPLILRQDRGYRTQN